MAQRCLETEHRNTSSGKYEFNRNSHLVSEYFVRYK